MANETIVKKGEQVKAIEVELEDVKQQMEILKAKANVLQSDKAQLTKEIVELKHNDNHLTQEPLITEWIDKMKSKYGIEITLGLTLKNGARLHRIDVVFDNNYVEYFHVSETKSEPVTKEFLDEIERTIILANELKAQNVLKELNA